MPQSNAAPFHPKRWTAVTWLAVLLWAWCAFTQNYPPSKSYPVDPVTGELLEPTRHESLSELPFPIGFPLHYVTPSYRSAPLPVTPLGARPPRPAPSRVSLLAMIANLVLVVVAISALVYLLQKTRYRYSLRFLFGLTLATALYFAVGRLVAMLAVHGAHRWYFTAVYFSPVAGALAVRYSLLSRIKWRRLPLNWGVRRRCIDDYDNADDAIAAASRLEMRGDWAASIALYRHAARRWPEHAEYVQQCISRVADKQSLAET